MKVCDFEQGDSGGPYSAEESERDERAKRLREAIANLDFEGILPPEDIALYHEAQQSIVDARRSAFHNEGKLMIV